MTLPLQRLSNACRFSSVGSNLGKLIGKWSRYCSSSDILKVVTPNVAGGSVLKGKGISWKKNSNSHGDFNQTFALLIV